MAITLKGLHVVGTTWRPEGVIRMAAYAAREGHTSAFTLVPDSQNPHDPQAVKVLYRGHHMGFLAREQAASLQSLVTRRGLTRVEVSSVTTSAREGTPGFWLEASLS